MPRVLVAGAAGQIGSELMRTRWPTGWTVIGRTRRELDLADGKATAAEVERIAPDLIVNAAAYTAVDRAESEADQALAVNRDGPAILARHCARHGAALLHLSTDYVFDGLAGRAYREDDEMRPPNAYGATKAAGEQAVRSELHHHIILRTSWVFGAGGHNFVKAILRRAAEGAALRVVADQRGRPTPAHDVAAIIVQLAERALVGNLPWGTFHYAGAEPITWHGFARAILDTSGRADLPIAAIATSEYPTPARRPLAAVLDTGKIEALLSRRCRPWREGLDEVIAALARDPQPRQGSLSAA
jgi:dTDP-4-dehydrorhamnose reductase